MLVRPLVVLVALLAASVATVRAQAPAAGTNAAAPAVDVLVDRALSRAPSLDARRERIRAAQSAARAADALEAKMVKNGQFVPAEKQMTK